MLEYDIDEAQALLEKNLSTATKNLDLLEEDLDFLRDQFTTTEVSILSINGCKNNIQVTANLLVCFYLGCPHSSAASVTIAVPAVKWNIVLCLQG